MKSARRLSISILIALCLSLASGCSTLRVSAPLEEPDQAMMLDCQPAPALDETKPLLLGDLLQADADLAAMYRECQVNHHGLSAYIRRVKEAADKASKKK